MRALIELFDRSAVKNVLGACIFKPDIVVYLCDKRDSGFFKESAIYRLFKRRKLKTVPRFYYFDATDPVGIRRVLGAVVRDYPGCVFDFTGGRDLVLLVAGASFGEMQLPGFYMDVPNRRFINLRGCQALEAMFEIPEFSVEDVFAMSGATVHGSGHFESSVIDAEFEADILEAFQIVNRNPRAWGEFVAWLQRFCSGTPAGQLEVEAPRRQRNGKTLNANPALLERLLRAGLITRYEQTKTRVRLRFKSPLARKCLLIEGVWLELYCYVVARHSGLFGDVRTSVVVDWDGVEGGTDNAKNEVDVLLVKGVSTVFISCKMSVPSALALSEVKLLSDKFGGGDSQAVVLTAGHYGDEHRALRSRAEELGIALWDAQDLPKEVLTQRLCELVAPPPKEDSDHRLVDSGMLPELDDFTAPQGQDKKDNGNMAANTAQ